MDSVVKDMVFMDVVSFALPNKGRANENIIPFKRDEFGYMKGQAIIGGVGVQNYKTSEGKTLRVLRHPDEVFDTDSLMTLAMMPLVIKHPAKGKNFTPVTLKGKQVGSTGERIVNDAYYIYAPINVTGEEAQELIISGKMKELSIGYRAGIILESGEYQGRPYDARQVNIRGNHLAIVKKARSGTEASFVLADGSDYTVSFEDFDMCIMDDVDTSLAFLDAEDGTETNQPTDRGGLMAKFTLASGQVVEADQAFIDDYSTALSANKDLEGKVSQLETDHSAAITAKDQEIADSKESALTEKDVHVKAAELITVRAAATKASVEFSDDDSAIVIMAKTAKAIMPMAEFADDDESAVKSFFVASQSIEAKPAKTSKQSQMVNIQDGAEETPEKKAITAQDIMDGFDEGLATAHEVKQSNEEVY